MENWKKNSSRLEKDFKKSLLFFNQYRKTFFFCGLGDFVVNINECLGDETHRKNVRRGNEEVIRILKKSIKKNKNNVSTNMELDSCVKYLYGKSKALEVMQRAFTHQLSVMVKERVSIIMSLANSF